MRSKGVENEESEDFATFYERSRDDCLRTVYAAVGDASHAEDLIAEAFAKAYANWRKVRLHPAPRAWVVRVALNTHVSWWRRRRREVAWDTSDEAFDPAAETHGSELPDRQVMGALRMLPRRQREVVALRIFLDLDTETTARALGISPGTVKAHLARASTTLRETLAPTDTLSEETVSP